MNIRQTHSRATSAHVTRAASDAAMAGGPRPQLAPTGMAQLPRRMSMLDALSNSGAAPRALGEDLSLRLDVNEIRALVDCYRRADPEDRGLGPEDFKRVAGAFLASKTTVDPTVIFRLFDVSGDGSVNAREFVLGYALLCHGSTEERVRYLFSMADAEMDGTLTREQLVAALRLVCRYAAGAEEVTQTAATEAVHDAEENIDAVVDSLLDSVPDAAEHGLSYADFFDVIMADETVMGWLSKLSDGAGEYLHTLRVENERVQVELDLTRAGILEPNVMSAPTGSSPTSATFLGVRSSSDDRRTFGSAQSVEMRDSEQGQAAADDGDEQNAKKQLRYSKSLPGAKADANYPFIIDYDTIKFQRIIGRGACATVWACEWLHMPVAVKVFHDADENPVGMDYLSTSIDEVRKSMVGDYLREIELLTQIRHPSTLLYMGVCMEPKLCIVTELYLGGSVYEYLHGPNPHRFGPEQALEMISSVARGMLYLHSMHILHRDLKTRNILVDRNVTHCVICDFGLSRLEGVPSSRNASDARGQSGRNVAGVGTPTTMAPEIIENKTYTQAADVYSFGVVMYEMYTGRIPYSGLSPIQMFFMVTEGERPEFFAEDCMPPALCKLIESCWAQKPESRPDFDTVLNVLTSSELGMQVEELQRRSLTMRSAGSSMEFATGEGSGTVPLLRSSSRNQTTLSKSLIDVVYAGDAETAAHLLDRGASVMYSDYDKRTALHVAAAEGKVDCLKLLIQAGADCNAKDRWGNTPLADALTHERQSGVVQVAPLLRAAGAVESRDNTPDEESPGDAARREKLDALKPALMSSALERKVEAIRYSIALCTAISENDEETVQLLVEAGVDVNACDYDGRTPLTVCAYAP